MVAPGAVNPRQEGTPGCRLANSRRCGSVTSVIAPRLLPCDQYMPMKMSCPAKVPAQGPTSAEAAQEPCAWQHHLSGKPCNEVNSMCHSPVWPCAPTESPSAIGHFSCPHQALLTSCPAPVARQAQAGITSAALSTPAFPRLRRIASWVNMGIRPLLQSPLLQCAVIPQCTWWLHCLQQSHEVMLQALLLG